MNCSKKIGGEELKKRVVMALSAMLTVATLVMIWRFSAQVGDESSALSGRVVQIVTELPGIGQWLEFDAWEFIVRKFAHGIIYLVLGFGLAGVLITRKTRLIATLVPFMGMMLAVLDEFHQSFVPGRSQSLRDVVIDTIGVCLGMILMLLVRRCYRWGRRVLRKNPS